MTQFGWGVLVGLGIAGVIYLAACFLADCRIAARQNGVEL